MSPPPPLCCSCVHTDAEFDRVNTLNNSRLPLMCAVSEYAFVCLTGWVMVVVVVAVVVCADWMKVSRKIKSWGLSYWPEKPNTDQRNPLLCRDVCTVESQERYFKELAWDVPIFSNLAAFLLHVLRNNRYWIICISKAARKQHRHSLLSVSG